MVLRRSPRCFVAMSVGARAPAVPWVSLALALSLSSSSCARPGRAPTTPAQAAHSPAPPPAPPPLALIPADVARVGLVATFAIPSLERSLASGVALVKQAAPLPLVPAGVRDMLLAQAGLPPEVARHLDLGAPIGVASVVGGQAGTPFTAFSFATPTAADVPAILAGLGRVVGRRGNAVQVENATGDRGWFLSFGNVVVFADTDEALVRAGSLAMEARRAGHDDVSVTLYPDLVARAAGTTVGAALSRLQQELQDRAAAGGNKLGPEGTRQLGTLIAEVGDIATADLALDLDPQKGASLVARLRPRAGSRLEALAREGGAMALDPALLRAATTGDTVGVALTSAYRQPTLDQLVRVKGKLPGGGASPGASKGAARLLDSLIEGLNGPLSLTGRLQPALSGEIVLPARDAAAAARIQTALMAVDKDSLAQVARAATAGEGLDLKLLKARRETLGKGKQLHLTLAPVWPATAGPALHKWAGPAGLEVYLSVVKGDRLAIAMGDGARLRLAALASDHASAPGHESLPGATARAAGTASRRSVAGANGAAPPAAAPAAASAAIADALAAAGGRSLFIFLDLRQIVGFIALAGGNARVRLVTAALQLPLPILGGAAGDGKGQTVTLDLTIPPSCFTGLGAVIQAAMFSRN